MYRALLKKYIAHLMDLHGTAYFADALSLCDLFPGGIDQEEYVAFNGLVAEVLRERGEVVVSVREGLC
ncbi:MULTISPECIES: hypothetical protein [unclassified Paludibacterium]|uniref:hypothetical protein n=1 Tax=unclassified Paludibacterium TaxID=2618429 RepID=UPI001C04A74B|nr:hypothetical protein [Paludibacterium sp. B53371]BEV71732.1 hypothetical protein THUN1379_12140 [Paludibacterium sp. THUN1379]